MNIQSFGPSAIGQIAGLLGGSTSVAIDLGPLVTRLDRLCEVASQIESHLANPTMTAGDEMLRRATLSLQNGWPDDALRDARASIDAYPLRAAPWLALGLACLQLDDGETGFEALTCAVKYGTGADPRHAISAALLIADLAAQTDRAEAAVPHLVRTRALGKCLEIEIALASVGEVSDAGDMCSAHPVYTLACLAAGTAADPTGEAFAWAVDALDPAFAAAADIAVELTKMGEIWTRTNSDSLYGFPESRAEVAGAIEGLQRRLASCSSAWFDADGAGDVSTRLRAFRELDASIGESVFHQNMSEYQVSQSLGQLSSFIYRTLGSMAPSRFVAEDDFVADGLSSMTVELKGRKRREREHALRASWREGEAMDAQRRPLHEVRVAIEAMTPRTKDLGLKPLMVPLDSPAA